LKNNDNILEVINKYGVAIDRNNKDTWTKI